MEAAFGISLLTMDQNATDASPDIIGGLPPPPGVIPNFIDPPKNKADTTAVATWLRTVPCFS